MAAAGSPALTGKLEYRRPYGGVYLSFEYSVWRVWHLPLEALLSGGVGTLPLAPLADAADGHLADIVQRMKERLDTEVASKRAGEIWTATPVLMGLRYSRGLAERLLRGVRQWNPGTSFCRTCGKHHFALLKSRLL